MAHNLPDETLSLFAVGALEKNEIDHLITLVESMDHTQLDKIGTYQFLMSLIPTSMKLDSPHPKVKEAVARKLLGFQDEILKKIQARQSGEKELSVKAAAPVSVEGTEDRKKQSISDELGKEVPEAVELAEQSSEFENLPSDDSNAGMDAEILTDDLGQETEAIAEELQTDEIRNFLDEEFSADGFNIEKYDEISNAPVDHLKLHDETFTETPEKIVSEEFDIPDDISPSSESSTFENDNLIDDAHLTENISVEADSDLAENEFIPEPIDFEDRIADKFEINKTFDADIDSHPDDLPIEVPLAEDENIFEEEQKFDFSEDLDKQFFKEHEFEKSHNITPEPSEIEIMENDSSKLSWILPALLLAALLVLGYFFITSTNSLKDDVDRLEIELSGLNSEVSKTRQYITNNSPLVEFFNYKDLIIINLDGKSRFPEATGKLLLSFGANEGLLQLNNLPQLEENTSYQLWLRSGSQYYSMGTFQPDGDQTYFKITDLPIKDKTRITSIQITEEPMSGSNTPKGLLVIDGLPERKSQSGRKITNYF